MVAGAGIQKHDQLTGGGHGSKRVSRKPTTNTSAMNGVTVVALSRYQKEEIDAMVAQREGPLSEKPPSATTGEHG